MSAPNKPHIFIDSGAFSAWTKKEVISLPDYIAYLQDLLTRTKDVVYANLDVIGDGEQSYANWKTMRGAGLDPVPIWHVNTDESWLRKYLKRSEYIGIGAMANMHDNDRIQVLDRVWQTYLIGPDRQPTVKVHGMGLTSFPLMRRYPWYSVDSTSWIMVAAFGSIYVPQQKNGEWDYTKPPMIVTVSVESPKGPQKGQHFKTFGPLEKVSILRYVKDCGYTMGKGHMKGTGDEAECVVEEPGIATSRDDRACMNAWFFARFMATLPYPRPFRHVLAKGLFA